MAAQKAPQANPGAQEDDTNQLTAAYFAGAVLGLSILFTGFHLVGLVLRNHQSNLHGPFTKRVVLIARCGSISKQLRFSKNSHDLKFCDRFVRSMLLRKVPGFTSLGHAFVFIIYLAFNLSLIFQNINLTGPTHLAKRMGW
jgi:hypothetical protein